MWQDGDREEEEKIGERKKGGDEGDSEEEANNELSDTKGWQC